jgi:hypothetical protein
MLSPNDTQRHAIYGMTGSGKTTFALWQLAQRSYDRMPWIIVDFKRDKLIRKIPRIEEISVYEKPPRWRGLYVVRPDPADVEDDSVTQFFYDIWKREKTGVLIDECYMIKRYDPALRALLTQGRSKRIPMIVLSQKPSWISPFIHSESEFKSVFFLQMPEDIKRVQEWLPPREDMHPGSLPPHESYWYCLPSREFAHFGPCPDENAVLDMFDDKVYRRRFL